MMTAVITPSEALRTLKDRVDMAVRLDERMAMAKDENEIRNMRIRLSRLVNDIEVLTIAINNGVLE